MRVIYTLLLRTIEFIFIVVCAAIIGLTVPVTISIVLDLLTPISFLECTSFAFFWVFSTAGFCVALFYIDDVLKTQYALIEERNKKIEKFALSQSKDFIEKEEEKIK